MKSKRRKGTSGDDVSYVRLRDTQHNSSNSLTRVKGKTIGKLIHMWGNAERAGVGVLVIFGRGCCTSDVLVMYQ